MSLRGYTADHRFQELALSLVKMTRGPLHSSKAINQLEKGQRSFNQPHGVPAKSDETMRLEDVSCSKLFQRRRADKIPPPFQIPQEKTVCSICKPQDQRRAASQERKPYNTDRHPKFRIPPKQDHLPTPADDHTYPTGARDSATGMEGSLRKLSLNDNKGRKMDVSQVDGLVDYSSSEEEDSDDSSDGKPHI